MTGTRIRTSRSTAASAALLLVLAGFGVANGAGPATASTQDTREASTSLRATASVLAPLLPADVGVSTVPVSEREKARERVAALREATAARLAAPQAEQETTAPRGRATAVHGDAASDVLSIRRNHRNTRSQMVSSTLAEPAAANDQNEVFYSGNTYNSYSGNSGATWSARAVHAGPADANVPCCDPDVVHHRATDTTFSLLLYTNSTQTNGVVDIEVRRGSPSVVDCIYRIDPGGTANNVLPDYPHMATTNGFLFLSTNNIRAGSWIGANTRRFTISQMSQCQRTSFSSSNYVGTVGQRIHVPAETQGSVACMYWAQHENNSTMRWFQWCDSNASPTSFTRATTTTNRNNPDCRGGTGNFDFIERGTSWSIAGFRGRAAVGGGQVTYLVNVSADSQHPQAHLHGQTISRSTLGVVANPVVWNEGQCFGYPALGSNSRNDLALSFAVGGRAGGGGSAARGYVAVDDASSAGIFFPSASLVADGTHNRSDSRWGDYFTVRGNDRCLGAWSATSFSLLNGNTASAHVNARYVEMQSTSQAACP